MMGSKDTLLKLVHKVSEQEACKILENANYEFLVGVEWCKWQDGSFVDSRGGRMSANIGAITHMRPIGSEPKSVAPKSPQIIVGNSHTNESRDSVTGQVISTSRGTNLPNVNIDTTPKIKP